MIKLNYLDHVAIYVADMEKSAAWYEKVLGLKKHVVEKWTPFPIFMLAGKCGIALFPADTSQPPVKKSYKGAKIDHFAFNVDNDEFLKARKHYEALGIKYNFQDHFYFHSIYTQDPDGHTVELTTMMVEEEEFFD
ncbi:MAG: VOC family protein [Bacteroidota bacterium]